MLTHSNRLKAQEKSLPDLKKETHNTTPAAGLQTIGIIIALENFHKCHKIRLDKCVECSEPILPIFTKFVHLIIRLDALLLLSWWMSKEA